MSKTTKCSSSPGKEYFENAAKQIPWPVEIGVKKDDYKGVIHIPHFDLDKASDNLMVQHLIGLGFVIQQTISEISETKIFDPVIRLKDHRPVIAKAEDEFSIGKCFKIVSSGTRMKIINSTRDSLEIEYMDGEKLPIRTSPAQLTKSLNLGVWIKI